MSSWHVRHKNARHPLAPEGDWGGGHMPMSWHISLCGIQHTVDQKILTDRDASCGAPKEGGREGRGYAAIILFTYNL